MLSDILRQIRQAPGWAQVQDSLQQRQTAALYDIPPALRLLTAAAVAQNKPVLYVLPNERQAQKAAEDAVQLGLSRAVYYPQRDIRFLRAVSSREVDWQRFRALDAIIAGQASLVICSIESLQEHLPPPEWLQTSIFTLHQGDSCQPQEMALQLAGMGYERVDLVEGKGQFALRGDIMDIYPPTADQPVRTEFFDIEIDSLRPFDPLTQRSLGSLDCLRVTPAGEWIVPPAFREQAANRLLNALEEQASVMNSRGIHSRELPLEEVSLPDIDALQEEGSFSDITLWAHLVSPGQTNLLAWMPDAALVLDTPDRALQRMDDYALGYAESLQNAMENHMAHPAQAGLLFTREAVRAQFAGKPTLLMQELLRGMGGLAPDRVVPFSGKRPESYRSRLQNLAQDLNTWKEQGFKVFLLTGGQARSQRLAAALAAHQVTATDPEQAREDSPVRLMNNSISEGFVFEGARLVLLSPEDLFGTARQKARKTLTAGQRIEAFTDLSKGDYVVHEHHGIGIYEGTVRLQSEGVWRDYLLIRYQGTDKLYVPTDQFERVQKYIGSQQAAPVLNDLSSNTWSRQKSKVKAGLKQLAFDLVKLYAARQATPGYAFERAEPFEGQFADQFEHELTPNQEQAVAEVLGDMEQARNMDRLLCGDVGFGKTEVAIRAAFRAVMNSKQVAVLAPTTILVQQHMRTFSNRFEGFPVKIGFVSRFQTAKENKKTLELAREGRLDILIGTHRLLSKDVKFHDLGLLIIDEEQRFGVRHKEQIKNYKSTVDVLTLSATPIPRTLHMSMVGVRDMSLLESPPEERFPVTTYVVDYREGLIRDAILRELAREGQVFFLYNRVQDIERMAAKLRQLVPEARIAVAHGQMPENALEDVMLDFYAAKHDVLLCSTIIENGLDIQNANTLIVYDADHFGLSQLYQLRGRVGRSNRAAYAFFTVRPDKMLTETAEKRLAAIKEFTAFGAGFRIAMRDLEIRGAGNIFGPEQSGQVAVVGYDMYVRMIEEAIREAQGDFSSLRERELETQVTLSINAFLPEHYVQGENQRIEIYKRIAMLRSQAEEEELVADLIDRFGEPEDMVMNLIRIARLRSLANRLGADQVRMDRDGLVLRFHPQYAADPMLLYKALSKAGRRMNLHAGKRTTLLVRLAAQNPQTAVLEGIRALESLLTDMDALQQQQDKTPPPSQQEG